MFSWFAAFEARSYWNLGIEKNIILEFRHSYKNSKSCNEMIMSHLNLSLGFLSCQIIHCGWTLWQYRLWSFQGRDTKLERFLAKNQLLYFRVRNRAGNKRSAWKMCQKE